MTTQPPSQSPSASPYCDLFEVNLSPWGAGFRFGVRIAGPQPNTTVVQETSKLYMSLEHLKAMAFILSREILRFEKVTGLKIPLGDEVLITLKTSPEEWNRFWYGWQQAQSFGPSSIAPPKEGDDHAANEPAQFPFAARG